MTNGEAIEEGIFLSFFATRFQGGQFTRHIFIKSPILHDLLIESVVDSIKLGTPVRYNHGMKGFFKSLVVIHIVNDKGRYQG